MLDARYQQVWLEEAATRKAEMVDKLKEERHERTKQRTFDSFNREDDPDAYDKCKAYVDDKKYKAGSGLLLSGLYGAGKTHMACAIAHEALEAGTPAIYNTWPGHLQKLKDEFREDDRSYLNFMKKIDLLIIDDLGKEKDSEWASEIIFEVINARYEAGRAMVITTNLTPIQLEARYPASYSRLCEVCSYVDMTGRDHRKGKKKNEAH